MKKVYKLLFLLCFILSLSACHSPTSTHEKEQLFICKSLIEGFFNMENLHIYQLSTTSFIQEVRHLNLAYRANSNLIYKHWLPKQQLNFQCQKSTSQQYQLFLIDDEGHTHQILSFIQPTPMQKQQMVRSTVY